MKKQFFAGYSAIDITPEVGEFGSFRLAPNKRSVGILNRLYLNAFYLTNTDESLLLISIDVVALLDSVVEDIKQAITDKLPLTNEQILIATTHTHGGPETIGEEPHVKIENQIDRIVKAAIEASSNAVQKKFAAKIGWGSVACKGVIRNRLQSRMGGDENLVDDKIDFLRIDDIDGCYKGVLWHCAAHPTASFHSGYLSSIDYYGATNRSTINALEGFSVFFNGACGNTDILTAERSFECAEHYGKLIGAKLSAEIPKIQTIASGNIASKKCEIEVSLTSKRAEMLLDDDLDEIMKYFGDIENFQLKPEEYEQHWATYQRLRCSWWKHKLFEDYQNAETETVKIQVHQILDSFILSIPGEPFIELQFQFQKFFDFRVMIFGYANGYMGYIPDADSFEKDQYETRPSWAQRVSKTAGEDMINAGKELVEELINKQKSSRNAI